MFLKEPIIQLILLSQTVIVAQLVRASDCGSGGRGFEPPHSPKPEFSKALVPAFLSLYGFGIHLFRCCILMIK